MKTKLLFTDRIYKSSQGRVGKKITKLSETTTIRWRRKKSFDLIKLIFKPNRAL